jgi:serine/threonine-protein phosphatase 2A regulatory subunit B
VAGSDGSGDCLLEASRDPTRKRLQSSAKLPSRFGLSRGGSGRSSGSRGGSFTGGGEEAIGQDFASKLLHLSWHPSANVIATAASNSLYLFYGEPQARRRCYCWCRNCCFPPACLPCIPGAAAPGSAAGS